MDEKMEETVEIQQPKKRKQLSEEALEKLRLAREKANAKRKELAEQRAVEKEKLIQERIEQVKISKAGRLEKQVDKEAKKRIAAPVKKKDTVVVEYSSTDSEDIDFEEARVMFVKRERKKETPKVPTEVPTEAPKPPTRPDPVEIAYRRMFGY